MTRIVPQASACNSKSSVAAAIASTLPTHPLAELFPLMNAAEFASLVGDMKASGFRDGEEIIILDGQILDGRNRYRAAVEAGIFPADVNPKERREFVEFPGGDALDFVLSKNLHRRHLNETQRAMVAANLANMRQGERTDKPSANLQKVAQKDAAKLLHVSPRSVADAVKVKREAAPALLCAVQEGKIPVSTAAMVAALPVERQLQITEEAHAGRPIRSIVDCALEPVRAARRAKRSANRKARRAKPENRAECAKQWEEKILARDEQFRQQQEHRKAAAQGNAAKMLHKWKVEVGDLADLWPSLNFELRDSLKEEFAKLNEISLEEAMDAARGHREVAA